MSEHSQRLLRSDRPRRREPVVCPDAEWSGLFVSVLSGRARADLERAIDLAEKLFPDDKDRGLHGMATLVALTVVDDAGQRVFADDEIEGLKVVDSDVLAAVWKQACALNGLRQQDVEEAAKN
jgi:hypothetical protein